MLSFNSRLLSTPFSEILSHPLCLGDFIIFLIGVCSFYLILTLIYKCFKFIKFLFNDDIVKDFTNPNHRGWTKGSFPNGWIPVSETQDLRSGCTLSVQFCGQDIVLFRGYSEKVYAIDAFCPHIGAHFSSGKVITNQNRDCIRCMFHHWAFRGEDGVCVEVPYAQDKRPPKGVKVKVWQCCEINNFIYVWHHSKDVRPSWYPTNLEEIESGEWVYAGRSEHLLNCRIEEIPENGADGPHFNSLHSSSPLVGSRLDKLSSAMSSIFRFCWENSWTKCDPPNEHKAISRLRTFSTLGGFKLVQLDVEAEQTGPAFVNLRFQLKFAGQVFKGAYIQGITPLELFRQKIVHRLYVEPRFLSHIVSRLLLIGETIMLERDIEIWREKIYLRDPRLVKEDKLIAQFRRWYSQFLDHKSDDKAEKNAAVHDW